MRIIPFNYNNVVHCKICALHSFQLQQQGLCVSFLSTATTWYTSRLVRIIPFNCNYMVHFKICEYHPANFKRSPMTPRVTHTSDLEFQLTQLSQWEKGDGTARWKGPETCRCFKKVVSVCRKRTARCESAAKLKLQKTPRGLGEET